MNNLVSIVMPSYNAMKYISDAIDSVLKQTYQEWELIIVDDKSPDDTNSLILKYIEQDNRIQLIKLEKNSGTAVARNIAIEKAKGRYIAFLDADDLWLSQKLDKQIAFMNTNTLAFTYSSYTLIDEMDNDLGLFSTSKKITYDGMLKTCDVGCLTAIYDTQILSKVYMPNILKRQDYALWLKILKKIRYAQGILEPLAVYRIRKNSLSANKISAALYQWKIYRKLEKLNLFKSIYYFIQYTYFGLKKYK